MDAEKDYYAILGVLPSVDSAVLQAVYRALAKKYHPDTSASSSAAAFVAIQEAYEVLSDPTKRARYDEMRRQRNEQAGRYDQAEDDDSQDSQNYGETGNEWAIVEEYEPIAARAERQLRAISTSLALLFRAEMLRGRNFGDAERIARSLEKEFLSNYFGDDEHIQNFAKHLLVPGREPKRREAARELNRVIRIIRAPSNPNALIAKIARKFDLSPTARPPSRPYLPNGPEGWFKVTQEAMRQGWVLLAGGEWRHAEWGLTVKADTPEKAWDLMELDSGAAR